MQHVVYIQDRPLIFYPVYEADQLSKTDRYEILSAAEHSAEQMVEKLENKNSAGIYYLSDNPDQEWKEFVRLYTLIEAAGGVVLDLNGNYLLILRKGKWDLPKGKIEYDESPEVAAIREVEEECGIDQLSISEELPATFHTYKESGKKMLKKTHWYRMKTESTKKTIPQTEEDIEEVVWMNKAEIKSKVYKNTYGSIVRLLDLVL